MNDDLHSDLFEVREPPRGGLAGLRARIDRERRRRERTHRMRWVVAGSAAILVLIVIAPLFLRTLPTEDPLAADLQLARMRLGIERAPTEPLTIPVAERHRIAAQRVPLSDDRVILYRIGTTNLDVQDPDTSSE